MAIGLGMIANSLGPWWFPAAWRQSLIAQSSLFFDEAAWVKHDKGYHRGIPSRADCDWKLLQAMVRDASRTTRHHYMAGCLGLAFFYYLCVRLFG